MKMKWVKSVAIICVICVLLVIASCLKLNINEAKEYQNITQNSMVLKLDTNKMLLNGVEKMLDADNPRTMPYLDENWRTLVPIRCVSENFGANVLWDASKQEAIIKLKDNTVSFTIGSNILLKNGKVYEMDTKAIIYEDRTYIPLRALMEIGIDKQVYWDGETQLIIISDNNEFIKNNLTNNSREQVVKKLDSLSTVGNFEVLKKLLDTKENTIRYYTNDVALNDMAKAVQETSGTNDVAEDYSKTNVQVENVDEADIVKTNGRYVYYLSANKLVIVDAKDASNMKIVAEIDYDSDNEDVTFSAEQMYLNNNTLVIIGNERTRKINEENGEEIVKSVANKIMDIYYPRYTYNVQTKVICYDVSNPKNILEKRTVKTDGYYINSRMIDENIYFISDKNIYTYYYGVNENLSEEECIPQYYDSVISNQNLKVGYNDIRYFPEIESNTYTFITSFNVNSLLKANVETFLGMGQNIYMDLDNLYVSHTKYNYEKDSYNINTIIYKFDVINDEVKYNSKGTVTGSIINQFAMNELDDNFIIATTNVEQTDVKWDNITTNEIHILDKKMKEISNITGIAKDERIYSVRYFGKRAYMVTYRETDPLFVIDLSDANNPSILGELKIEGYSSYLHPYDETHLIGIGMDTHIQEDNQVEQGGMKVAMFDVTNPKEPLVMFEEIIGEAGTYSTILEDHKALLFNKEKEILAFPIIEFGGDNNYDDIKSIGAIIYKVNLEKGFEKCGIISHFDNQKNIKEEYYKTANSIVNRIIYINDNYITLSYDMIKCSRIKDLVEVSRLNIEVTNNEQYYYLY